MKILFIAFHFPPIKAIASIRTWNICKGLLAAGHEVQVVTVDDRLMEHGQLEAVPDMDHAVAAQDFSVLKVPSLLPELYGGRPTSVPGSVRKWLTWQMVRVLFRVTVWFGFDPMLLWSLAAWRKLRNKRDVDLVLVSGGPFSSFLPATLLASKLKCQLVLDYRDVWNDAPHVSFRLSWRRLERWWLRRAGLITSVSPSCLQSILSGVTRPAAVITNGVSDHVYQYRRYHLAPAKQQIVYAGAFYPPTRSVEPFFKALALARARCGASLGLSFVYLGSSTDYVRHTATAYGLDDLVTCLGTVSHDESLQLQAQSLCTLVVTTIADLAEGADRGIMTGKLYEAIDLARNVLVISPANSDARGLTLDIPHVRHFTGSEYEAMAVWLEDIRSSSIKGAADQPRYFSWEELSSKYAMQVARVHECR
jgi:glycosyltransferase involved in cell wall biosynthesis